MRKVPLLLFLWTLLLAAQTEIGPPLIGFVPDQSKAIRPVLGVAGNFLLGEPVPLEAVSLASSGQFTLVKTPNQVIARDNRSGVTTEYPALPGSARFAFSSDGQPALVYLASTRELRSWPLDNPDAQPLVLPEVLDEILALAPLGEDQVELVVRRQDVTWRVRISRTDGAVFDEAALAGVSGPVLLTGTGWLVSTSGEELRLHSSREDDICIPLPAAVESLDQMGEDWVRLVLRDSRQLAVRIRDGSASLYRLPVMEAKP